MGNKPVPVWELGQAKVPEQELALALVQELARVPELVQA
jgi:hypothetical protein